MCHKCFNSYCSTRWVNLKIKAIAYMGGNCERCGYDHYYGALEFHHLDPNEKDYDWDSLKKRKWDTITSELDKCIMLCANCHREVHAEQFCVV